MPGPVPGLPCQCVRTRVAARIGERAMAPRMAGGRGGLCDTWESSIRLCRAVDDHVFVLCTSTPCLCLCLCACVPFVCACSLWVGAPSLTECPIHPLTTGSRTNIPRRRFQPPPAAGRLAVHTMARSSHRMPLKRSSCCDWWTLIDVCVGGFFPARSGF